MRKFALIAALALAGCATTPDGLARKEVKSVIPSTKSAKEFATCVAENLPSASLRDDGERYWVVQDMFGFPSFRWDFIPTETGSIAETRSTALGDAGAKDAKKCA